MYLKTDIYSWETYVLFLFAKVSEKILIITIFKYFFVFLFLNRQVYVFRKYIASFETSFGSYNLFC